MPEEKKLKLPRMERFRVLPELKVPLVGIRTPKIELPEFPPKLPKLNRDQIEAVRYGIMDDVSDLVPVFGDFFSDTAFRELRERLSPEEFDQFIKENQLFPSSLAVLKVFAEKEKS